VFCTLSIILGLPFYKCVCRCLQTELRAGAQLVEALCYKPEGRGFDSRWCHWNFSLTQSFRPHHGPVVDSASNRNEHQEYIRGVKAAGVYGWQPYHLHVSIVLKSGSLNLLEPSGPAQACNGIALPLPFTVVLCILLTRLNMSFINYSFLMSE